MSNQLFRSWLPRVTRLSFTQCRGFAPFKPANAIFFYFHCTLFEPKKQNQIQNFNPDSVPPICAVEICINQLPSLTMLQRKNQLMERMHENPKFLCESYWFKKMDRYVDWSNIRMGAKMQVFPKLNVKMTQWFRTRKAYFLFLYDCTTIFDFWLSFSGTISFYLSY